MNQAEAKYYPVKKINEDKYEFNVYYAEVKEYEIK